MFEATGAGCGAPMADAVPHVNILDDLLRCDADLDDYDADLSAFDADWDERDADPEYHGPVSDLLASLATSGPNRESAAALAWIDPFELAPTDQFAYLQAVGRLAAWVESLLLRGLVASAGARVVRERVGLDDRGVVIDVDDLVRDEIALAMRWSPAHAQARIATARRVHALLPATFTALAAGEIDGLRAAILAEHAGRLLAGLPDAADPTGPEPDPALVPDAESAAAELERRALPVARRHTPGRLRSACERAVSSIDPAAAAARAAAARRGRDVRCEPFPDGQAVLEARLDAATAVACQARVQDLAERFRAAADAGDRRNDGEWRADAFATLLLGGGHPTPQPQPHAHAHPHAGLDMEPTAPVTVPPDAPVPPVPYRAQVDVVIDLPTLLGLADHPAELRGHGPVPADTARALLALAEQEAWRRLVTDPLTGHLLDYGRSTYRVPEPLRRFLHRRDGTCRFPGCPRRSTSTGVDLDHATAWQAGGGTDRANLGCLCRRHHQAKTHGGWRISDSAVDGTCTWTSPHGLRHDHRPPTALDPPVGKRAPVGQRAESPP